MKDVLPTTSTGCDISDAKLLGLGYREYAPNSMIDRFDTMFQKRVTDDVGALYFINFRKWVHQGKETWDAQLCCDSDSDGYLWATVKEHTIKKSENRVHALWEAAGSKRYDD